MGQLKQSKESDMLKCHWFMITILVMTLPAIHDLLAIPRGRPGIRMPSQEELQPILDDYGRGPLAQLMQARRSELEILARKIPRPTTATAPTAVNIPLLLGRYSNSTNVITVARFDTMLFKGPWPTGTMKEFYSEVSYNQFSVTGSSYGWFVTPQKDSFYVRDGGTNVGLRGGGARFSRDLVAAADSSFNFSQFDSDGDGFADIVMIVHTGAGGEVGASNIWSHRWSFSSAHRSYPTIMPDSEYVTNDPWPGHPGQFIKVNEFIIQPELYVTNPITMNYIGVFCHEFGHVLGLPDLYDVSGVSEGAGAWDLMSSGSYGGNNSSPWSPTHMSAWCKEQMGWSVPTLLSSSVTGQLVRYIEKNKGQTFKFYPRATYGAEYFLIENRQKQGFDASLVSGGLLIWHVDTTRAGLLTRLSNSVNTDPNRFGVGLVQADGQFDLERKRNRADSGDPFPGSTNTRSLNAGTIPSSKLYTGLASGIALSNISDPDSVMTVNIILNDPTTYVATVGASPPSLTSNLSPNQEELRKLTIQNSGNATLTYSLAGIGAVTTVGDSSTITTAATRKRGMVYLAKMSTTLREIRQYMNFTVSDTIFFVVYSSSSSTGPYTLVGSVLIPSPGTGKKFFSSGLMSVPIDSGKYYFVGISWRPTTAYYSVLPPNVPNVTPSFGDRINGGGENLFEVNATIPVLSLFTNNYLQTVVTGDTYFAAFAKAIGQVKAGSADTIGISFNASGLANGTYKDTLLVRSNDPVTPVLQIPVTLTVSLTEVVDAANIPLRYELNQNFPNPFNPSTTIKYEIPREEHVVLRLSDILGRQVAVLTNGVQIPGKYELRFDSSHLASGVYFYTLESGAFRDTKKMMLLK